MYLLKNESIWTVKQNTSEGFHVAKSFCKVELGNRVTTSFWFDDWSMMGRFGDVVGARGVIVMGIPQTMTVARMENQTEKTTSN